MLEIDPGKVVSGVALNIPLAGTPHLNLSFDGPYGFNFVGMLPKGQEEIGQITTQDPQQNGTGPLSGTLDISQAGTISAGIAVTGNFTLDSSATGNAVLQTSTATQHMIVRGSGGFGPVFFMSTDSNLVAAGIFEHQQ